MAVFIEGVFGRWLGHEGWILINGISVFIEETPASSPAPYVRWGHSEKMAVYELACSSSPDTKSASTLIVVFSVARAVRQIL